MDGRREGSLEGKILTLTAEKATAASRHPPTEVPSTGQDAHSRLREQPLLDNISWVQRKTAVMSAGSSPQSAPPTLAFFLLTTETLPPQDFCTCCSL